MSRNENDTDSSNEGSGTDSEEDQKADELSSRSESSTASDDSESESDATESRFMLLKNNEGGGDKRPREEGGAPGDAAANNKRPKLLGARPPPGKSESQMKASPASRNVGGPKNTLKKPGGKPAEDRPVKKKETEPTGKKPPQAWSSEDEHTLILNIFKDMKSGMKPPKRGCRGENYHYWNDLHDSCQGKFLIDWSKDQLYDKYRRMKSRYDSMVEKERTEGISALKFKNSGEEKVYNIWKQMYEMLEQEEPEPPTGPKPENKRATPQPQVKSKEEEEAAKKDVPSSSKKAKVIPPRRKPEEPRQNGATASVEEKSTNVAGPVQELQRKYNAELAEMKGKFEQMMNELQARSRSLVQDGSGSKPEWLNEWLMLSMARNSMPLFNMDMMMTHMLGGVGGALFGGISDATSPAAVKFKEHWLKQQEDELRVMEQRLRLLQELCQHQQELLKKNH